MGYEDAPKRCACQGDYWMKDGKIVCVKSWWKPDVDPRQSAFVEAEIERKGLITAYLSHLMEQVGFAAHGALDSPLWLMTTAAPLTRCLAALNAVAAARAAAVEHARESKGEQL
jgi:hypothetical protein